MITYAIGIGSNLDDRISYMRAAVAGLADLGEVRLSSLYESAPVGGPEQGPYLNAVAVLKSQLGPSDLLVELHRIEHEQGRERQVRWGARTLDLDIVLADGIAMDTADLTIPHPRAHLRRFVIEPLAEVWPDAELGERTAASLLDGLRDQEIKRLDLDWVP